MTNINVKTFAPHLILSCILGDQKAAYISTPITNGPRLVNFIQRTNLIKESKEYKEQLHKEVIHKNCEQGFSFANTIRNKIQMPVIDPSRFNIEGWSQEEYLYMWCNIIKSYSNALYFNEGWSYSSGCAQEFLTAKKLGIPTYNHKIEKITKQSSITLFNNAISDLELVKIDTSNIKIVIAKLKDISE